MRWWNIYPTIEIDHLRINEIMAPAVGQPHSSALGEARVGRVAVDLQHACKPHELRTRPSSRAIRGVDIGDAGRISVAPGAAVARTSPKLAGLGATSARIEHQCRGLVGMNRSGFSGNCNHGAMAGS